MPNRRDFLKNMPVFALSYSLQAKLAESADIEAGIKKRADELAGVMKDSHGGQWKVTIDSRREFILVSKML